MINTFAHKLTANKEYTLRLANKQGWHIITTKEVNQWVEKLASIMELGTFKANHYPKLIFLRRNPRINKFEELISDFVPPIKNRLPAKGWRFQELGLIRFWFHQKAEDVICEIGNEKDYNIDIIRMYQAPCPIYTRAQCSGGLPFHAALVEYNGLGVMLAAQGNTGKTTCCRRLPQPWNTLCDDETLIVRDDQNRYMAHPFPTWSDYIGLDFCQTRNIQKHIPLTAAFFLEQAKTDEVIPIKQGQTAIFMIQSAMQVYYRSWRGLSNNQKIIFKKELFENATELAKSIPAYILRVSLNGRFWNKMEKVLF